VAWPALISEGDVQSGSCYSVADTNSRNPLGAPWQQCDNGPVAMRSERTNRARTSRTCPFTHMIPRTPALSCLLPLEMP
jgi:hypothetical protein